MRKKHLLIAASVAGLILVGSVAVPALKGISAFALASGDDVPVHRVERDDFVRRVRAEGNLQAVQATPLSPPPTIRGSVRIAWLAPDGSPVDADDIVIRFDPTDMEKKLRDGQSDRATAESRMTQKRVREDGAMKNLERDSEMAVMDLDHAREFQSKDARIFTHQEIIESEIDQSLAGDRKEHADEQREARGELAETEQALLGIERHKAELQIQQAEQELHELEVRAPHAGIFVIKEMWGNVPAVGSMVWPGQPIAEIPGLDEMEAKVYVLEADAGGLAVGLSATVVLDSHAGSSYQATVKSVDALAQPRSRRSPVQYFGVVLELEATDAATMKPGQRVQATLILAEHADVLSVPRQAVMPGEDGDVVYVRRAGGFEAVSIEIGATGLGRVVVESGLSEGDIVALRDPTRPLLDPDGEGESGEGGSAAGAMGGGS